MTSQSLSLSHLSCTVSCYTVLILRMENPKFLCRECGAGYKNKSSLRRHINVIHNNKRYVCGKCNKQYNRNADYIKHITRYHQPLIIEPSFDNISTTTKRSQPSQSAIKHSIEATTSALQGDTDWTSILQQDLALSDDEDVTTHITKKISIGTITDKTKNPDTDVSTNPSPLALLNLGGGNAQLATTHDTTDNAKPFFTIATKPTTQVGCIPLTRMKSGSTQTDEHSCNSCTREDHLISLRQNYIREDAVRSLNIGYNNPITSREDRSRMPLSGSTNHQKWKAKLNSELKPKSPSDFVKIKPPNTFTNPELKVTSAPRSDNSHVRKPTSLTIDNETYEAICSRKRTRPMLVTSPRKLFLPAPPPSGAWSYSTTKF